MSRSNAPGCSACASRVSRCVVGGGDFVDAIRIAVCMYMLCARKQVHLVPSMAPPQLSGSGPTSGAQSSSRNRSKYCGITASVFASVDFVASVVRASVVNGSLPELAPPRTSIPVVGAIETVCTRRLVVTRLPQRRTCLFLCEGSEWRH